MDWDVHGDEVTARPEAEVANRRLDSGVAREQNAPQSHAALEREVTDVVDLGGGEVGLFQACASLKCTIGDRT